MNRYVDIYVPVGPGAGTSNPVKAMLAGFGALVMLAVLVMIAVTLAFPSHRYPVEPVQVSTVPVTTHAVCAAFCPQVGGEQR